MTERPELLTRASIGPKYLTGPAPDREEWQAILRFLENTPCHDDAYPFRIVICEDREALGEIFLSELPEDADDAAREKAVKKAKKGPGCLALILRETKAATRRDRDERLLSAGAALMRLLDALHLAGFAAKTVSGKDFRLPGGLYDPETETLLCFVLCGRPAPEAKTSDRKTVKSTYF